MCVCVFEEAHVIIGWRDSDNYTVRLGWFRRFLGATRREWCLPSSGPDVLGQFGIIFGVFWGKISQFFLRDNDVVIAG